MMFIFRLIALGVIVGSLVLGFTLSGGHIQMILHPAEVIIILGMAFGGWLAAIDGRAFLDTVRLARRYFFGVNIPGLSRQIAQLSERLLDARRKDGTLAVEKIMQQYEMDEQEFRRHYPLIAACPLIKRCLFDAMDVYMSATPEEAGDLALKVVDARKRAFSARYERVSSALERVSDWLPGFGIVAAVLGVILAMGLLGQGLDIAAIGKAIGIALAGTLLGVFMAFGIVSPLSAGMRATYKDMETAFDRIKEFIMLYDAMSNPKFSSHYLRLLEGSSTGQED